MDKLIPPDDISNEETIDSWDRVAEEFASEFADGEEFYHKNIIVPAVVDLLGDIAGKTILDLACGEGHVARRLAELANGNVKITGVDASQNMIRIARERNEQYSDCINFQVADACNMSQVQSDSFDISICNMALMDIKDYEAAIKEAGRVLKPNGVFIFSILHPCFMTPGCGWIKIDPERTDPENKIGWKVDNYHYPSVSKSVIKALKDKAYYFHRTLEDYFGALREGGFMVADIREPVPSKELIEEDPGYRPDLKMSTFLVVKNILI